MDRTLRRLFVSFVSLGVVAFSAAPNTALAWNGGGADRGDKVAQPAGPEGGGDRNSGDVWLDNVGQPSGPGHEHDPHLKCSDINLWGAGLADSAGTFTIDSWPPSGHKEQVYGPATWTYSSGKKPQVIAVIPVRVLVANAMAAGASPNSHQGFHFKLQLVQDPSKHKTFWVRCGAPSGGPGSIEIFKASTTSPTVGLAGARFTASNESTGQVFTTDYTNAGGFSTNTVPAGTYRLTEIVAPVGFQASTNDEDDEKGLEVTVAAGLITDITILDAPCSAQSIAAGTCQGHLSSLIIFKVGPDNMPLAGATFVLMALGSSAISAGPVTTDSAGHATLSGVVPGKYTLHETAAPAGFVAASDTVVDVGASAASQFVMDQRAAAANTVTVTASPSTITAGGTASATVTATVTTSGGVAVAGTPVAFTLSGTCGTLTSATATTNAAGVATVVYLSSTSTGSCTITATEAATGSSGTVTITQTAAGPTTSSLTVFKVGPDNAQLPGATFVLMAFGTTTISNGPVTTDSTGHATFSPVVVGKYTLHESAAPAGFVAAGDIIVDIGTTPAQQFVVDQRAGTATGNVVVTAVGPSNQALAGAAFTLIGQAAGSASYGPITTTTSGQAIFSGVVAGNYTLHETAAPAGFTLAADVTVMVAAGGTTNVTVLNTAVVGTSGSLVIYKVGQLNATTQVSLGGAQFVLMPLGSTTVAYGPVVTDASGHATLSGVAIGKYVLHETVAPAGYNVSVDILVDIAVGVNQQFVIDTPVS